jgi:S-adenosylmethionine:tRNA ribosyltransferase-isomerase
MRIEQLDYELPPELIAQQPVEPRDQARLLVLDRATGTIRHHRFTDLAQILAPADCLVLNDTRVVPARLVGRRAATGGRWEGLFLRELDSGLWEMMCQTRGRPQPGESIEVNGAGSRLILRDRTSDGHWLVEPQPRQSALEFLARQGHVPLPPYIRGGEDEPGDRERYQTVFAERPGAVAAPTAGLHFTRELLGAVEQRGLEVVRLTLHVGLGTFQPIRESVESHAMHAERGELRDDAANRIVRRRAAGGRVVAVGTTCVRVLETAARGSELRAWSGETSIFICPPYPFRAVDAMITNFHLPRTTLLALVYAFAGEEQTRAAYAVAIRERYRFYSFGDAMLIL